MMTPQLTVATAKLPCTQMELVLEPVSLKLYDIETIWLYEVSLCEKMGSSIYPNPNPRDIHL
jgi:hypothetical protein